MHNVSEIRACWNTMCVIRVTMLSCVCMTQSILQSDQSKIPYYIVYHYYYSILFKIKAFVRIESIKNQSDLFRFNPRLESELIRTKFLIWIISFSYWFGLKTWFGFILIEVLDWTDFRMDPIWLNWIPFRNCSRNSYRYTFVSLETKMYRISRLISVVFTSFLSYTKKNCSVRSRVNLLK